MQKGVSDLKVLSKKIERKWKMSHPLTQSILKATFSPKGNPLSNLALFRTWENAYYNLLKTGNRKSLEELKTDVEKFRKATKELIKQRKKISNRKMLMSLG